MSDQKDSIPKNFQIKCPQCNWSRTSSGIAQDLSDLTYIKSTCKSCGKYRRYRCPKCGAACPLKRIRGNN